MSFLAARSRGIVELSTGRNLKLSLQYGLEALQIQQSLLQADPQDTKVASDLAKTHHNIGVLQAAAGERVEALESYRQARGLLENLLPKNDSVSLKHDLAIVNVNLGNLQSGVDPQAALAHHQQACDQ